jgi:1-acyl-sn-glycerol-3-phosphate acyltransferase
MSVATTSKSLLVARRFWPIFTTQFCGAFNDNFFKSALVLTVTFQGMSLAGLPPEQLVALAGGVFILPFFLLSAVAGELSDKYAKARLIRVVKIAEIAIMGLGAVGFFTNNVIALFAVLFLMGVHSTIFGPLKYGILPELLQSDELVGGNALIETGTFLAILLGTIGSGALMALGMHGGRLVAAGTMVVAIAGYLASRAIPIGKAAAPELVVSRGLFGPTRNLVRCAAQERSVVYSILGISWFWLMGAIVLSVLPTLVKQDIGGTEAVVTYFLALFSVGVGAGSMLCKRLSARQLELGLVPIGSFGITVFLFDASVALRRVGHRAGTTILQLMGSGSGVRLTIDLALFAVASGVFIVPLYTLMQERSNVAVRARVIAANNVVNAAFMVAGAALLAALFAAGASISLVFALLAALNLAVAIYIYTVIPEFLFRFICFCLAHFLYRLRIVGGDNIPKDGPAVLVCNHVTFVDWLVLAVTTQRPMRFVMHHSFTRLPFTGRLFRDAKVIPIAGAKENPEILEAAFTRISKELKDGEIVCIFPEGQLTRDGKMGPFRRGIERIIATDPVVVIPMRLDGLWKSMFSYSTERRPFGRMWQRVELRIGEPLAPEHVTAALLEERVAALGFVSGAAPAR